MKEYIYEVKTEKENLGGLMDSDLWDSHLGECYEEVTEDEAPRLLADFVEWLESYGAKDCKVFSVEDTGEKLEVKHYASFTLTEESVLELFKKRYEKFREASDMTLEEFSTYSDKVYAAKENLCRKYGDAYVWEEYSESIESWIRDAQYGVTYYVGTIISIA